MSGGISASVAMYAAIAAATVSAAATFVSSQQQTSAANAQAEYQAKVAAANAQGLRNQAETEKQAGVIRQQQIEAEKEEAGRKFRMQQGQNVASLAASGVEITSGSAMDLLEGNIDLYSQDIGTNFFQQQLNSWETRNKVRNLQWQASVQDSQASFHRSTIVNSGQSLLTSGLKGLGAGLGTYAAFGGGFGMGGGSGAGAAAGAGKTGVHGSASGIASQLRP